MQRRIIEASLVGSLVIILASFGFFNSLLMFVLVGAIPGTNDTLSPTAMSLIFSLCAASTVAAVALPRVTHKPAEHLKKKPLPKRRYSRL